MQEKNYTGIIPEQQSGIALEAESNIELNDDKEAKAFFNLAKSRLQQVNNWHELAGTFSGNFQLADENGNEAERSVQKGDHFKIDIPGPGTKSGKGYDWVQVEEVESISTPDVESFGFRVRPAHNPQKKNEQESISHFYSTESTSSFTVTRERNRITAAIYDRNTKTNKESELLLDKVRNTVIGTAAILSFSKVQWQALTDAIVKK